MLQLLKRWIAHFNSRVPVSARWKGAALESYLASCNDFSAEIVTIGLAFFFSERIVIPSLISLILICTHCLLVVFEIAQLQIYNLPFVIQACNLGPVNNNSGGGEAFLKYSVS